MAKAPAKGKAGVKYGREPLVPSDRMMPQSKWQGTHGMFITGQSMIDAAKLVQQQMTAKWGAGRLRLLVDAGLRDKFDRQRYLFNQAIWYGDLEDVRTQSERMIKAWRALDRQAEAAGASNASPDVWEVEVASGVVYAFFRTADDAKAYDAGGRTVRRFALDEVCRVLDAQSLLQSAKDHFPGAEVVGVVGGAVGDVLEDVWDTRHGLDDPLDDPVDDIPY